MNYIPVPALNRRAGATFALVEGVDTCSGCAMRKYGQLEWAVDLKTSVHALCATLYDKVLSSGKHGCDGVVWIEDTDEAKAEYTARRLTL